MIGFPLAGPHVKESMSVLAECWARIGDSDIATYPYVCRKPVDPDGLGLCGEHLALYRGEERGSEPAGPSAALAGVGTGSRAASPSPAPVPADEWYWG